MSFCRDILEPYEKMFPRRKDEMKRNNSAIESEKKVNTDSIMLILI
jgi:hypothetical protein